MQTFQGSQVQKHITTPILALPLAPTSWLRERQLNEMTFLALAAFFASAFYFYFYFTILRRMLFLPGG